MVNFDFFIDELERLRIEECLLDVILLGEILSSKFCILTSALLHEYKELIEPCELALDFLYFCSRITVQKFLLRFLSFIIINMYKTVKAIAGKNKRIMLYDSI